MNAAASSTAPKKGATVHPLRRGSRPPPPPPRPPARSQWRVVPVAVLASLALHAGVIWGLQRSAASLRPVPRNEELAMEIVPRPPPKAPEPPPPPEKLETPRAAPRVRSVARPPAQPPPKAPPPPNQQVAKSDAPPPPIHIGVSLESTVTGGAVAVPIGNTLFGEAPKVAPAPAEVKPYWAEKYVSPFRVAELPVILEEVKVSPYPAEARKAGIEGQVIALLTIDDQGRVARVRKVSGPGHGLDEAAVAALAKFKFKPARLNGQPVATEIRYVYSFEIE
jgi:periplasmic protein TonB